MAEPATTSGLMAGAIGAGTAAALLAALGLAPQPLFWALVGATLGMSVATQAGRLRACIVFGASVLASALLGTYIAQEYLAGARLAANASALLMGAMFHPLLGAATSAVPAVVNAFLRRIGLGT